MSSNTTPKPRPKVVAYLRVSGPEQKRRGGSLATQERGCRLWAERNGYELVAVHTDVAAGDTSPLERPGIVETVKAVESGRVAGVIVQRLDRVARDVIGQEAFLGRLAMHGGRVFSSSTMEAHLLAGEVDDLERRAFRRFVGALSEYDRALLRSRLEEGKQRKRAAGGYTGGRPPLGFRAVAGRLVADAQEQAAVARAVELRSVGHSFRTIAAILSDEGYRNKAGTEVWHSETVRRLCARAMPAAAS